MLGNVCYGAFKEISQFVHEISLARQKINWNVISHSPIQLLIKSS